MDALVMCGGRGTRLATATEKPLVEVAGERMVDRVLAACADSGIDETYAVVSPNAPETATALEGEWPTIETPGEGYVADLQAALEVLERPVLTVAADLPLLAGSLVDDFLAEATNSSYAAVPVALKERLGVSTESDDGWVPAGLNVVGDAGCGDDGETTYRSWDARLAVNVNRRADLAVAEALLDGS